MNWLTEEQIIKFMNHYNYDIRRSHNARWIDQKCTPDVLCIIADCILEFVNSNPDKEYFSSLDIWHNEYTVQNVESIFKKPNPDEQKARNEYDKFFQQPMELFSAAGILNKKKVGNRNYYKLWNKMLLEYISIREMNALKFLELYNTKVLKDSGIYNYFEVFLNNPTSSTYEKMKHEFGRFTVFNTPINGQTECNRIFTKVLNPIAFMNNTYGTEKGRISKDKITKDMLMYNRNNFRDIYVNKPKEMTRAEYYYSLKDKPNTNLIKYQSAKAKKLLKAFNDAFNNGLSEVNDALAIGKAVHMHHIFPENEFQEISSYVENLIALTPGQHLQEAHPDGNTRIIDKGFQQICLLTKANHIEENIKHGKEVIYSFDNFTYVLSVGFDNNTYEEVEDMNFTELVRLINMEYITCTE